MEPVVGTEAEKMPSGHPAFCASDLISQVHGILSTAHNRGTGTRPPGVHEATHAKRLPSAKTLSQDHGVSHITAERALTILKDEGLITPVIGKGYYVAGT